MDALIYILLAAGSGTRMGPLTSDRAKVLVEVEGRSILEHNLRNIVAVDADAEIIVVAGFAAPAVEAFVSGVSAWANARVVVNPDFANEGPLRSIAAALATLGDDARAITIGNGDTIFERRALAALRESGLPLTLLASEPAASDEDDVQLRIGADRIEIAAKRLGPAGTLPISAGLLQIDGVETIALLRDAVGANLAQEREEGRLLTWHSIVARLAGAHPQALKVPHDWWWEFDSPDCLARYGAAVAARATSPNA